MVSPKKRRLCAMSVSWPIAKINGRMSQSCPNCNKEQYMSSTKNEWVTSFGTDECDIHPEKGNNELCSGECMVSQEEYLV